MSQRQPQHSSNALSNQEDERYRFSWIIGSKCLIHSEVNNKWMIGEIISIINDNEGEWLNVKYIINKEIFCKPIQRFSRYIKPIFNNININNKRTKLINIEKSIIIESLFDVLNNIQINILIKIINKKIKVKNNQQRQEIIPEEKYNEQKEQDEDILTIIKREKGHLFHTKVNDFSSNSVARIKFILSMYNIWLLNNDNNNHIKKNKNLSFHEIIENYFDNKYKYVNFVIDYRNITNIKNDANQSNICNANTSTKSNIPINNIKISDTDDDDDDDIIICEYKHNNITYSNNINDKSNNQNFQIKITKPTNNKLNKRRKKSVSTRSKSGHSHLSSNNNNINHLVTPNMRFNNNFSTYASSVLSSLSTSVMSSLLTRSPSLLSSLSTISISNSNQHEGNNSTDNSGESSIDSMDRDISISSGDSSEMNLKCKSLSTELKIDNNKIGFLKPNEFSKLLANYHENVTSSIGNDKNNIAIKKTAKQFAAIQEKLLYIQQQNNKIIKPSSNHKLKVIHSNNYHSNAMSDIDINNIIKNASSNGSASSVSSSSSSSCNDTQCSCNISDNNTSNSMTSSRESSVSSSSESTVSGNSSQTSSGNTGHSKISKSFHNRKKTNKNNDTQIVNSKKTVIIHNDNEGEQYKSFKTLLIHDNYVD